VRILLLGVMLILLLGQVGCVKSGGPTQDQLLAKKIQCAEQAREYWRWKADDWCCSNASRHTEEYTYSPRLNTCILYEDQHTSDGGEVQYFIDVLTGRNIVPPSITVKGQTDSEAPQTWLQLFSEANVDLDYYRTNAAKKESR
jgi:hypothetical protein